MTIASNKSRGSIRNWNAYQETHRMSDTKDKVKETIDAGAAKAKEATDKAAEKAREAAKGVGKAVQNTGKKIADIGK
jgi:methyl-accepting chemotaxis protein